MATPTKPHTRGRKNSPTSTNAAISRMVAERRPAPAPKHYYNPRIVPPAPKTQEYLNLCEVAAEYGGSTWTWRHRALRGVLPSVKLAGEKSKLLIPRSAIEEFFARGYRPQAIAS